MAGENDPLGLVQTQQDDPLGLRQPQQSDPLGIRPESGVISRMAKPKDEGRSAFSAVNDTVIEGGNAAAGLLKAGVDLFSPGSAASQSIEGLIKSGQEKQSDWKKAQRERLQQDLASADGEIDKAGQYLKHALVEDPLGTLGQLIGNVGPFGAVGRATAGMSKGAQTITSMGVAGGVTAGEVRGNIFDKINNTPDAALMEQSPEYAELRKTMGEVEAKREIGADFFRNLPEVGTAGLIGMLGGKYGLEGMAAKVAPGYGRLRGAAIGVADEATQGAVEQLASNYGVRRAIPEQGLMEDVALNAAAEGILGVGGALVASPREQAPIKPPGLIERAALRSQPMADAMVEPGNVATDLPTMAPQDLTVAAQRRMDSIVAKLNGTPDTTVVDPATGQEVVIPGEQKQIVTPAEQAEIQFLTENAANPQALAEAYGVQLATEQAPAPDLASQIPAQPAAADPAIAEQQLLIDEINARLPPAQEPVQQQAEQPKFSREMPNDDGAHEAATSPMNDLADPTQGQIDAGTYKVGRQSIAGLNISVENPEGSTRRSHPDAAKQWENTVTDGHYGYIRGVPARATDGEHVDTYVKPGTAEDHDGDVFVVNQIDPETGKFDETKNMIGYGSAEEAKAAYMSNYEPGWQGFGDMVQVPMSDFKSMLQDEKAFMSPVKPVANPIPYEAPRFLRDTYKVAKEAVEYSPLPMPPQSKALEKNAHAIIDREGDALVDRYIERFGNVVDPDQAKLMFSEFELKPELAAAFHEPSSRLSKMVYAKLLATRPGKTVLFSAGGGGSGKSVAIDVIAKNDADIADSTTFDGTLASYNSSKAKIDTALDAGAPVRIIYTNREVGKAFEGAMERSRVVPIDAIIDAHVGAAQTIRRLAKEYAGNPNVEIEVINNNGSTIEEVARGKLDDIPAYSYDEVKGRLYEQAKRALDEGRIDQRKYEILVRGSTRGSAGKGQAAEPWQVAGPAGDRAGEAAAQDEVAPKFKRKEGDTKKPLFNRITETGHRREGSTGRYVGAPDWIGNSPVQLGLLRKKLRQLTIEGESGRYWSEKERNAADLKAGIAEKNGNAHAIIKGNWQGVAVLLGDHNVSTTQPKMSRAETKTGNVATPADAKASKAISILNTGMARYLKDTAWENAYAPGELHDTLSAIGEALEVGFGTRVIPIHPTAKRFDIFNGVHFGGNIYVNTQADVGFANIAGHELFHELKRKRPDLYQWFAAESRQYYKDFDAYQKKLNSLLQDGEAAIDRDAAEEELLSDFAGDSLADPKFLQGLADASPTKFRQLLMAVRAWIDGAIAKLKGNKSERYVTDLEAMRDNLSKALVAFAEGKPIASTGAPVTLTAYRGERPGGNNTAIQRNGIGTYYSNNPDNAKLYTIDPYTQEQTGKVTRSEIVLQKPYRHDGHILPQNATREEAQALTDSLQAQGYDGIIIDHGAGMEEYVLFPRQGNAEPAFSQRSSGEFFSPLQRAFQNAKMQTMTGAGWSQWLKSNMAKVGVKKDEVTWSGINEYLELRGKDKISKEEVAGFLEQNGVSLGEEVLGLGAPEFEQEITASDVDIEDAGEHQWLLHAPDGRTVYVGKGTVDRDGAADYGARYFNSHIRERNREAKAQADGTKFSKYVPDGGIPGTYREILVTLPVNGQLDYAKAAELGYDRKSIDSNPSLKANLMERFGTGPVFKSSHWKETPNVLVHLRVDEVKGDGNKRLMRVVELQSDWHQARTKGEAVDDAPFADTGAWVALGIKRAIQYGVASGVDGIVFATGQENADMYDLSNQVEIIYAQRNKDGTYNIAAETTEGEYPKLGETIKEESLANYVGKDLAKKISAQGDGQVVYRGLDLKVGGEGMRKFYDEIIPSIANKVLRQLGQSTLVGRTQLPGDQRAMATTIGGKWGVSTKDGYVDGTRYETQAQAREAAVEYNRTHGRVQIDLTPALVSTVNRDGIPLFSRANNQPYDIPEDTKLEAARRHVQDKFLRFQTIQEAIELTTAKDAGYTGKDIHAARQYMLDHGVQNPITDATDVYQAETLSSSRIASRKQDFREDRIEPLLKKTAKAGVTMDEIADYLLASHAKEANARVQTIRQDPQATAFGMTDQEAATSMQGFQARQNFADIDSLANEWRQITEDTKRMLVAGGIISQGMADAWDNTYSHYVPLKGVENQQGAGKGLSVNGKQKRRMGHGSREEAVIANILRDYERAVTQVERNKVGMTLVRFALEVADDNIITLDRPVKRPVFKDGKAYEVLYHGSVVGVLSSDKDARAFIALDTVRSKRTPADYTTTISHDPHVVMQASPMLGDNEVNVYVAGQVVRVQINDELAAKAYTNMGVEGVNKILTGAREFNTWLSKAYTGYNPEFLLRNLFRDAIQGTVTLTGKFGAGTMAKIYSNYPSAMRELGKHYSRHGSSQIVSEARADGMQIGSSYLSDIERIGDDVMTAYNEYAGMANTYQRVYAEQVSMGASKSKAQAVATMRSGIAGAKRVPIIGHFLAIMEHLNAVIENSLRLATYLTLRDEGHSRQQAAAAGKNLMNFNRKGEVANQAGALYLFFNPNLQGTHVMLQALTSSKYKRQAQALTGMMAIAAFALAEMGRGGDDDDEEKWKKIPAHVRDRNMVVMVGDKQITIPVPYGFGVFHSLGNAVSDFVNGENGWKLGMRMMSAFAGNFSPFGNPLADEEKFSAFQLLPTIPKMALGPENNENSFGAPLMPIKYSDAKPDSQNMFRSTKGTVYSALAEGMNEMTGGSKYQKGLVDVSPETLRFWVSSLTGGTGRFMVDTLNLGSVVAQGATPELREIPMARVLVREESINDVRRAYWDRVNEAGQAAEEFAAARRAHDRMAMREIMDDNRTLIRLAKYADRQQKLIKAKRDLVDRIRQDESLSLTQKRDKIKQVEAAEEKIYNKFIAAFDDATGE